MWVAVRLPQGGNVGCCSADAGRPCGLLAGETRKRMGRPLGSGAGSRRAVHAVGVRCTHFCPTLHATEGRCTQFPPALHANGVRYTQFLRPRKLREASNAQVDEAALLSGPRKNCVHHDSSACTVRQNCVQRAPRARNLREPRTRVHARTQRPPHPLPCLSRQQPTWPPRVNQTAACQSACTSQTLAYANAYRMPNLA